MEDYTYFTPRSLRNLELIDEMESLSPITDMKVADLTRELTPQIYTVRDVRMTHICLSVCMYVCGCM